MKLVDKKDFKVGEFYYDALSQKPVLISSIAPIGTYEDVVHVRCFINGDYVLKKLYDGAKLYSISFFEKILFRVIL